MIFVLLLPLLFFPVKAVQEPGMVYCPLQKKWVQETVRETARTYVDLGSLCISNKNKENILTTFASRNVLTLNEADVFKSLKDNSKIAHWQNRSPGYPAPHTLGEASYEAAAAIGKNISFETSAPASQFSNILTNLFLTQAENPHFDYEILLISNDQYPLFRPRSPPNSI